MAMIKLDAAWDRLEGLARDITGREPEYSRDGDRFRFAFNMRGHEVFLWAISESPRYCVQVDGALSFRVNNIKSLAVLLNMIASRPEPWTGNELWDD